MGVRIIIGLTLFAVLLMVGGSALAGEEGTNRRVFGTTSQGEQVVLTRGLGIRPQAIDVALTTDCRTQWSWWATPDLGDQVFHWDGDVLTATGGGSQLKPEGTFHRALFRLRGRRDGGKITGTVTVAETVFRNKHELRRCGSRPITFSVTLR
jgi:hypothetical protein